MSESPQSSGAHGVVLELLKIVAVASVTAALIRFALNRG